MPVVRHRSFDLTREHVFDRSGANLPLYPTSRSPLPNDLLMSLFFVRLLTWCALEKSQQRA